MNLKINQFFDKIFNIDNFISIFELFLIFEKFSKITFVCLTNRFRFFNIRDKINNISKFKFRINFSNFSFSIFRQKFDIKIIQFFQKHCEIISVSLTKNFVFFVLMINSITFRQKRQKIFDKILYQHSILNLFIVFKNFSKSYLII